jgi:hypothetical protein
MLDAKAMAQSTAIIIKEHVAAATAPLVERIDALENAPKPEPVTLDMLIPVIGEQINIARPIEPADDDADNIAPLMERLAELETRPTSEQVAEMIDEAFENVPKPVHVGIDAEAVGQMLSDRIESLTEAATEAAKLAAESAVAGLEKPQDGKSVTLEDVQPLIDEAVAKAVDARPLPKDGAGVVDIIPKQGGGLVYVWDNGRTKELDIPVPPAPTFDEYCPDDTADLVALAIKTMAEVPDILTVEVGQQVYDPRPAKQLPITLNINGGGVEPKPVQTRKTVTTRKDAAGNLVADIVETTE